MSNQPALQSYLPVGGEGSGGSTITTGVGVGSKKKIGFWRLQKECFDKNLRYLFSTESIVIWGYIYCSK